MLLNREINNLRKMFCLNDYPFWFYNKVLNKFVSNLTVNCSTDCCTYYLTIRVPLKCTGERGRRGG